MSGQVPPAGRRYGGRFDYVHHTRGVTGREWFDVAVHADGARTLRATCELDDERLLRHVVYSVDAAFRPLDAFVRLEQGGAFRGSAWFRFDDRGIDCESFTRGEGRVSQRVELGRQATLFAPHPVVLDGWQAAAFDYARGPGRQRLTACANSSPRPDGSSGPAIGIVEKDLEWVGETTTEVPAGRFATRHLRIHMLMPYMQGWPPIELWVHGEDVQLVRLSWALLDATYELVELSCDGF
jgi:hypothetical protein